MLAGYFMLTAKHAIKQALDVIAIQAGSNIENPDIKEYDGDHLSWRLQAETAQEQNGVVTLEKPVIDIYTEGRKHIPIQALHGKYDKNTNIIHLSGQVKLTYQSWKLNSKKLDLFQARDEIQVVDSFVMQQVGMKISGKDMRIFRKKGKIEVLQGIFMEIEENK